MKTFPTMYKILKKWLKYKFFNVNNQNISLTKITFEIKNVFTYAFQGKMSKLNSVCRTFVLLMYTEI